MENVLAQLRTNHETKGSLLALANTFLQQVLNDLTSLNLAAILLFPERHRPMLRLDVPLLEDVVKDILQIDQLAVLELELDQLDAGLLVATGSLAVSQPKFGAGHDDELT